MLCLQETKLQSCDDFICSTLWGNSSHAFSYRPSNGASGGLLTLWDSAEVEVWSSESLEGVLWCHGRFVRSDEEFYVANVYAPCDDGAKQLLWDSLSARIQALGRSRICVCGDFNAVRSVDERHSVARMRGLLDHCPLVLAADEEDWGPRPLRMLKCWKDVPGYKLFVREKWTSYQIDGWGGYVLKEKFKRIKLTLKDWHATHTQNLPSRIESLKDRLAVLDAKGEEDDLSEFELAELRGVSSDIHSLSRLNASICWQQSRSRWLKEGDANTKYFHSVLANRRRGNTISSLQVDNTRVEGVVPIRNAVVSHFATHFKAVTMERPGVENLVFKRLQVAEVSSLIKPFSMEEIKAAVWDCDSYKSPGPDGINFGFVKDFWAEIQGDVMRFCSEFHRNGRLAKGLNATFIALIPKVASPQRLNDFRPISLVGSLYKILAKVLANRLRNVMGSVISESQTAFVQGRQILDGILIANEVVDEARRAKKELLLFKVDFEKAYDSVDWGYLDAAMGRMGFPTLWRKWIKECVCTATASVLVNGSPTEEFPLERGLRQGDLLSPFLFLLAVEGLHVLMEAMVERNLFTGYNVGNINPVSVSHLQFADDTLLLGFKSWANVRALRAVLVLFESMSASALCCKVGKIPFLYLGLSIGGDPRRLGFWEPVVNRLKNCLSGWRSRFLSFGGRLVLLKSVLTSLPVYSLSFFKAPSGKWCWRMLVDREGLWFRVLAGRYGVERGRLCVGGTRGSTWWRELASLRDGGGALDGGWFGGHISRKRFERLFYLAENKSASVAEMFMRGWGVGGEAWVWRCQLRAWEEELVGECQSLLMTISLQDCVSDRWQWQPNPDDGYTVRGAYQLLTAQDTVTLDTAAGLIWHPQVPLKVSIFAWRLLRDRLPTKANLVSRAILSSEDHLCVSGCEEVESAQHLFLSCSTFGALWSLVSSWIGSSLVTAQTLSDHFVQFTGSAGGLRARHSFMQLIWLACVWVVWTERNHRLFRGSTNSLLYMLDKIKTFSFRWLKATSSTLALNCHSWWSSPMLCLGLV
ncbi:cysteine-rich receptor-like protein kinase [Trifolium medium]|uniref:Cysteine-rich receptor-like protein kinase n=1 Tax=Trifolium medium TaxID=97028 RepID=A0A392LWR8_9FABA|nr:cysteine-rich receptor-like protein kinase [Trifolium medium]